MGMQREIVFESAAPDWEAIHERLVAGGHEPGMRLIDGEIALPDEEPPDGWRELRVTIDGSMVTVAREAQRATVTTWGGAEGATRRAWALACWALAAAGSGTVHTDEGALNANAFAERYVPG
jgi:hypothetical protein